MSLRFPPFPLRSTSHHASTTADGLFPAAHNHRAGHPKPPSSSPQNQPVDLVPLLAQLQQNGESTTTPYILNKLISSCANLRSPELGIQLHCRIIKTGLNSNVYINTALINLYAKCRPYMCTGAALNLFDETPHRNTVTWNTLIHSYLDTQYPIISIQLFIKMIKQGISPTPFTISSLLIASSRLESSRLGGQVHGLCLKIGFESNIVVATGLIDMYSKCSSVEDSRRVFDRMPEKNVITWTSMVTGHAQNHQPDESMVLVMEMIRSGVRPNSVTYNSLLSSFSCPNDLFHCRQIHCCVIQEGLESNSYISATLLTVYSDCGCSLDEFRVICSGIEVWDQITWNAVIGGVSKLVFNEEAMVCFSEMRRAGINPDFFTFTSVLRSIGLISALEEGKQTHALVFKFGYGSNMCVQNGLVSMYSRCGEMGCARRVFSSMDGRDLISWNSLISGFSQHGHGHEAVDVFKQMRRDGVEPDLTTLLAMITACAHVGLIEKGLECLNMMKNGIFGFSIGNLEQEHYACIVDLYGRKGYLHEAEEFIERMPVKPGISVFKALLSSCLVHGNKEIAGRCGRKLVENWPDDPATYVLLANVLAGGGDWEDAAGVRKLMWERGVNKRPGFSRI